MINLSVLEWAPWNISFGGPDTGNEPLSGSWYHTHKTQLLGVLLAAASNFLISVSLNIQKCTHLRLACQAEPKPYYMSKQWWCATTLLALGEVGNFTAYGFAPIALVTPLGCVSVIGSAFISVLFLKKMMRTADILGGTLSVTGTFLLVTFAPSVPQEITARQVQNYLVSWPFLVYSNFSFSIICVFISLLSFKEAFLTLALGVFFTHREILEIIIFCILLYFYKRKAMKHIVVLLMMVALLASLTVIAVKAVASMITLSVKGKMQLTYPVFYIMIVLMATSCAFQVKQNFSNSASKDCPMIAYARRIHASLLAFVYLFVLCRVKTTRFLNQAMHLYEATEVMPINFVFFTTSAIISGVIFYREFQSAAFLSLFMFLFGCLLSFLGVFVIARNKKEEHLQVPFIDCGHIPGQNLTGKIQPDSHSSYYGTLNNEDDLVKSQD